MWPVQMWQKMKVDARELLYKIDSFWISVFPELSISDF